MQAYEPKVLACALRYVGLGQASTTVPQPSTDVEDEQQTVEIGTWEKGQTNISAKGPNDKAQQLSSKQNTPKVESDSYHLKIVQEDRPPIRIIN